MMERRRLSRNRSWVDLHRLCDISPWAVFHFRDYQNYFCRPLTSLFSTFGTFQIQVTSPPRRSSLVSPRRLVWKYFGWDSNPLYLGLRGKADVRLRSHAPSSQLSLYFVSKGPVNTCPAESLLGGVPPVGTCPGSHWEVCRCATARRSPYNCFSLG